MNGKNRRMKGMFQLLVVILCAFPSIAKSRPNIVILMADDLGIGDLGCYGNTTLNTPHIDSLARDGVKMTQHLASSSLCTPSRASFLTGRHHIRSGMSGNDMFRVTFWAASTAGLPANEITFAELAKQAGYKTALVGKWHVGEHESAWSRDFNKHPQNQGYDSWYGFPLTNFKDFGDEGDSTLLSAFPHLYRMLFIAGVTILISLYWLYRRQSIGLFTFCTLLFIGVAPLLYAYVSVEYFRVLNSILMRNKTAVEQPMRLKGLTGRLVNEGVEFLEARANDKTPFLLHMSWDHVHTFLDPSKKFKGGSRHGRYGDCVEEMDWGTGEIIKALDRLGFSDNTVLYFTTDQGAHIEERGKNGQIDGGSNGIYKGGKTHGAVDGAIRVPGIIKWPGQIKPGTVVDEMTSLMDIYPLMAKITEQPIPSDRIIDGKDIMPLILGDDIVSPHEFLFHYCTDLLHAVRYRPRTGSVTWKLVYKLPNYLPNKTRCSYKCDCDQAITLDPPVVYDMTSDPGEHRPIRIDTDETYGKIAAIIETAVKNHKKSIKPVQNQFQISKVMWLPHLQTCCNFPYCSCTDPKYPDPEKHMHT